MSFECCHKTWRFSSTQSNLHRCPLPDRSGLEDVRIDSGFDLDDRLGYCQFSNCENSLYNSCLSNCLAGEDEETEENAEKPSIFHLILIFFKNVLIVAEIFGDKDQTV